MGLWSDFLESQEAVRSLGPHAEQSLRSGLFIPQVVERNGLSEAEEKKRRVKQCTDGESHKLKDSILKCHVWNWLWSLRTSRHAKVAGTRCMQQSITQAAIRRDSFSGLQC